MSFKHDINRHVVTKGNYAFVAAGTALFSISGTGKRKRIVYNVAPGQPVAYVVSGAGIPQTVDHTTLTAADINNLYIGVGVDTNGDGLVDDIRHWGPEYIEGCLLDTVTAQAPNCGAPKVQDLFFDCTKCEEVYSAVVRVDDNLSRSFGPFMKSYQEFVGSVQTECASCDSCPTEHNCKEIACGLADALNNDLELKVGDRLYPDWKQNNLPRPYWVTRLHSRSLKFDLTPETGVGDCEDCTYVPAINTVGIAGSDYTLVGTVDPADNTRTPLELLQNVASEINRLLEEHIGPHSGSAYVHGGFGSCCNLCLEVNTCDDQFVIYETDGVTPLVPAETDPFETGFTKDANCVDCGGGQAATFNPTCGIRVIAEPLQPDCSCYLDKPLSFYGRNVELFALDQHREGGWNSSQVRTRVVQNMELPSGFGSWIQWLEYQQIPGGKGRVYNRSNNNKGWLGLPDSVSRANNAVTYAECDKQYCQYYATGTIQNEKITGETGYTRYSAGFHIPFNDTTTRTAWENLLDAIIGFIPQCKVIDTVSCA